jgi:hypothetical protein
MSSRSPMHRVFPPSEPSDGEHPQSFRLVVGGTQFHESWYLSAIVRLQGFSSGSPAVSPRRWSPKTVTTSPWVGRSKPGCGLCPSLSFKDVHHQCWEGSAPSWGRSLRGQRPAPSLSDRGEGVRRSWRSQLPRARLSDPSGSGAAFGAAFRHGSRKRFLRRRDSRCHPRTNLQLYGLLLVLASRVRKWARALWQQHSP